MIKDKNLVKGDRRGRVKSTIFESDLLKQLRIESVKWYVPGMIRLEIYSKKKSNLPRKRKEIIAKYM